MSILTGIMGLFVILLIQLFISEFYLKRYLKIKSARKALFDKGRNKVFPVFEIILIALFFLSSFYVMNHYHFSNYIDILPMLLFFLLLYFFRRIEEWIVRKNKKAYFHDWLASITFLVMILFILIGDFLS